MSNSHGICGCQRQQSEAHVLLAYLIQVVSGILNFLKRRFLIHTQQPAQKHLKLTYCSFQDFFALASRDHSISMCTCKGLSLVYVRRLVRYIWALLALGAGQLLLVYPSLRQTLASSSCFAERSGNGKVCEFLAAACTIQTG